MFPARWSPYPRGRECHHRGVQGRTQQAPGWYLRQTAHPGTCRRRIPGSLIPRFPAGRIIPPPGYKGFPYGVPGFSEGRGHRFATKFAGKFCRIDFSVYICNPETRVSDAKRRGESLFAGRKHIAEIAQLVEHNLAKVGVASSSLVFRSDGSDNARQR